jgi:hypothetical protein
MDGLALFRRSVMAQEFKPGEIVPQSGIYTITHDAAHLARELKAAGFKFDADKVLA